MSEKATVVIGAGLSGLHAAWRLQEAGQTVMLVEARQRVGGRIFSAPVADSAEHRLDLGPSWYWPEINPFLSAWVQSLGLTSYPQHLESASLLRI